VEAAVFVDSLKGRRQVVGLINQESTGLLRETRETGPRVDRHRVLDALECHRQRTIRADDTGRVLDAAVLRKCVDLGSHGVQVAFRA
jgi:hypothetical protein